MPMYSAMIRKDDRIAFQVISNHFAASTCMNAQESAYGYTLRVNPDVAAGMKKPPY